MSGSSILALVLSGMALAVFFYAAYKLLKKNKVSIEVGGQWYIRLSSGRESESHTSHASLPQHPQIKIGQIETSHHAEIEAKTGESARDKMWFLF